MMNMLCSPFYQQFMSLQPFHLKQMILCSRSGVQKFHSWSALGLKIRQNSIERCRLIHLPSCCTDKNNQRAVSSLSSDKNVLHDLNVPFPCTNLLELVAASLALLSVFFLYLCKRHKRMKNGYFDPGDWVMIMQSTPFNEHVFLRCPSLPFQRAKLSEEENIGKGKLFSINIDAEKVLLMDHHVKESCSNFQDELVYQRICVSANDGGTVSLDWPAHMDLQKEHGRDTTLLLVPGTPEGSRQEIVKLAVCRALQYGFFPVVMNPRGCAGSPLTTARLFSAADDGDVFAVLQFLKKARPWSAFVGVSWGYGANMLVHYLAKAVERSILLAAVCIDSLFDLDQATSSYPHHTVLDKKLTKGMVDILRANKELFEGTLKGFKVVDGLSATSVREFDKAISMISHGHTAIEEFYSFSKVQHLIGFLKIPALFIQTNDMTVPLLSVPQHSFAENSFTSLLLCWCPSSTSSVGNYIMRWCLHVVMEWLVAVECALLKGHHPLLQDAYMLRNNIDALHFADNKSPWEKDVNCMSWEKSCLSPERNPSLSVSNNFDSSAHLGQPMTDRCVTDFMNDAKTQKGGEHGSTVHVVERDVSNAGKEFVKNNLGGQEISSTSKDSEVLLTAEVVMNMLDVTMPGVLTNHQKRLVLMAVSRGETFVKALKEAVPEEVRGRLVDSVSKILCSADSKLILAFPNMTAEVKSKIAGKLKEITCPIRAHEDCIVGIFSSSDPSGDQPKINTVNSNSVLYDEDIIKNFGDNKKSIVGSRSASKNQDLASTYSSQTNESGLEGFDDDQFKHDSELYECKMISESPGRRLAHEMDRRNDLYDTYHDSGNSEVQEHKMAEDSEKMNVDVEEETPITEEDTVSFSKFEKSSYKGLHLFLPSSSDDFPCATVSQAVNTLSTFDDSTQMAINNVFGVVENIIDHLENESDRATCEKAGKFSGTDSCSSIDAQSPNSLREGKESKDGDKNAFLRVLVDMQSPSMNSMDNCSPWEIDCCSKDKLDQLKHVTSSYDPAKTGDALASHENEDASLQVCENGPELNCMKLDKLTNRSEVGLAFGGNEMFVNFFKIAVMKRLKVDICKKLGIEMASLESNLECDLEQIATCVALLLAQMHKFDQFSVNTILSTVQKTNHLSEVLPVDDIMRSSLAALCHCFRVAGTRKNVPSLFYSDSCEMKHDSLGKMAEVNCQFSGDADLCNSLSGAPSQIFRQDGVTLDKASLDIHDGSNGETSNMRIEVFAGSREGNGVLSGIAHQVHLQSENVDAVPQGKGCQISTSNFIQKALHVVGAIVPVKHDGKLDQERLVMFLVDVGHKYSVFRIFGKVALLWGGIRGSISLTTKLISFLNVAERSLFQRILWFAVMVLVPWSTIVLPLLPVLVQNYMQHKSTGLAENACMTGLYISAAILIVLWGRYVRQYEHPLQSYGLGFTSALEIHEFLKGLFWSSVLMMTVYAINLSLGVSSSIWIPGSLFSIMWLRSVGRIAFIAAGRILHASCNAVVEELLFRSWLMEEVAVDLGHWCAIFISGTAFSLYQRRLKIMPIYLLLSFVLFGLKRIYHGKLWASIGFHAGVSAISSLLQFEGLLSHVIPFWMMEKQPFGEIGWVALYILLAGFGSRVVSYGI